MTTDIGREFAPPPDNSDRTQRTGHMETVDGETLMRDYNAMLAERDGMREAIRAHYSAYMAGDELLDTLSALAAAAGLSHQGEGRV